MNEADTRANLIDPALKRAGWGPAHIKREEVSKGRILGGGKREKKAIADYVLRFKGQKLAVVEAKSDEKPLTEGLGQAKEYATKMRCRFAYSTNGKGIYQVDMKTGKEGPVDAYLSPEAMWQSVFGEHNEWRERFGEVDFETRSGTWQPRYYQHNAITAALEAIAQDKKRILLTMATGTGKTAIAFQIVWKLFHSKWTLQRDGKRRPRILFLADRNDLADQAFNAFSAFQDDALVRISPDEIRKQGRVPKNGNVFFTIFQTFMTGQDEDGTPMPKFEDYPGDFFDFIIVDECHRGGSNDESQWRGILDYFSAAVQLGLTATPKRESQKKSKGKLKTVSNAGTYAYFRNPVYVYSLKEGINDGYLTPFRVQQISTTIDDYTVEADDDIHEGEAEVGEEFDAERLDASSRVKVLEREKYRVKVFMNLIDQNQKTIVFCRTEEDALEVRDWINQISVSTNPNYCARVTASEAAIGTKNLKLFKNIDKTIPTILTTSRKLSTGIDVPDLRNIVLMRNVNSMIEFKQIIGRGTRLADDKDYFTVYDFVGAFRHFNDPDWDGEPDVIEDPIVADPEEPLPEPDIDDEGEADDSEDAGEGDWEEVDEEKEKPQRVRITLAKGKYRMLDNMVRSTFYDPRSGTPISAQAFIKLLFGDLPALFQDEEQLRALWSTPSTRSKLLSDLKDRGYGEKELEQVASVIRAEKSDVYDVLAYVAYNRDPNTRQERVAERRQDIFKHYDDKQREFIDYVLEHYIDRGVKELASENLPNLITLKYGTTNDAIRLLGEPETIRSTFEGFQARLYSIANDGATAG